tara:strand:+ start:606 stop:1319 length:714 start_codon:yes stop_codon:yes gene_type:complete
MKITKATHGAPNNYGDTDFEVEASVENKKEDIVDMSVSTLTIIDGNNNTVSCEYDREEASYAEKNETFSVNLSAYAKAYLVSDFKKAKAIVDLTTYKKEFKKLGDFDIPADHKSCIQSNNQIEFGKLRVYGVSIYRYDPPENASEDHSVGTSIAVKNISNEYIQKVQIKVQLIDRTGSNLIDSEDYRAIPPNGSMNFQPSVYAKSGKLKGAKLDISISSFHEIEHFNAESLLKLRKD